ncbi:hypothetical protein [Sphingosinicella rhizophila]|uniref:DUF2975 domain-containing protein n=1 Tax=Sphingosinicella rhizophila TaxID=3050082 RepID=A0ABU3QBQ1_9SPHN|nr:hypothetical protein [Sphingosinicella sp. GR2756]MDT9600707.1 hypothetical protein [Sphingosinicella sp. GR2756]
MTKDMDLLRQHSLWLARFTLFLLAGTAFALLLPTLVLLAVHAASEGTWPRLLGWSIETALPSIFYLYALWAIRITFRDYAAQGLFGPTLAIGCTRAGAALALGAVASAIVAPNLLRLLEPGGSWANPGFVRFDSAYLAVGVVGIAITLLGRLLRRAVEVQREAAQLRRELQDFF